MALLSSPAEAQQQTRYTNGTHAPTQGNNKTRREEFLGVYDVLRDWLINDPLLGDQPKSAREHLKSALDYNVPGGKLNRGMSVADSLSALVQPKVPSSEEIFQADVLGWCIEWLQAFFLVADDIMDNSVTRRGQPCWYRLPQVGLVACNDYIILESCIYRILQHHFSSHPSYAKILELFHETTHQTSHGQLMDIITAPIGTVDLTRYTLPTYMRIVTYKTAFYSFYLPVACGLLVGGTGSPEALGITKDICLRMGQYFQIQDDYLDCFGDPEVIGKIGTDIQDNKCSWLVVQALDRASAQQKTTIEEHYGKDNDRSIAAVKAVYQELQLEDVFLKYEQESYDELLGIISQQQLLPSAIFTTFLKKIYKRTK
ncbi:hypothetical protein WJX73_003383 [Symbiochloris irregularis]|uniref:Farnesyl diphosphate synthase n=1 Tax=Symbiochloris irregularis TaxID=706552 RepID=A0AAW1PIK5_9CHLO